MQEQDRLNAVGEMHVGRRDMASAQQAFLAAIEKGEYAAALINLSYLHSNMGQHALAHDYALRAYRATPPRSVRHQLLLLNRLRHFHKTGLLTEFVARHVEWERLDVRARHAVSAHLSAAGSYPEAVAGFGKALELAPDSAQLLLAQAQVLMFQGEFDRAERNLLRGLELQPGMPQAFWSLAQLRKHTPEHNHLDAIRQALARAALPDKERAYLLYALHKELDDLGDIPAAATALAAACRAMRGEQHYSMESNARLFGKMLRLADELPRKRTVQRDRGFTPIFIVGMFRSGTTLVERLLGGHPAVTGAGELMDFTGALQYHTDHHCKGMVDETMIDRLHQPRDWVSVGDHYAEGVRWRLGQGRFITDKMPPNFLHVGSILCALPEARIVHMIRHPMATCFSNLREMFSGASPYSYSQEELADYYRHYAALMERWHQAFPGRILDVSYEALTSDTTATMRRVAEFCGLQYDERMSDTTYNSAAVATASVVQVRAPVQARKVEKWEAYRDHLQPLWHGLEAGGLV